MSKFRIKLKIEGFELEVDGSREDLPLLREALTQQVAGVIGPATDLAGGEQLGGPKTINVTPITPASTKKRGKGGRSRGSTSTAAAKNSTPLVWRHDTAKYGSPLQSWTIVDKAIWLLYVAQIEANVSELSVTAIADCFELQFRDAGSIRPSNLSRDFAKFTKVRDGQQPLVSKNATVNPPTWFLTDAGKTRAQALVSAVRGDQTSG